MRVTYKQQGSVTHTFTIDSGGGPALPERQGRFVEISPPPQQSGLSPSLESDIMAVNISQMVPVDLGFPLRKYFSFHLLGKLNSYSCGCRRGSTARMTRRETIVGLRRLRCWRLPVGHDQDSDEGFVG